ncbi:unnamed protein product [Acanthocheilonema viteae]|uniref:non-specific serine/threonine protein kinase n=1 Tax=Acanthocheilonema viteae TaxID=6277 RepID=A0A498S9G8_ACAVI|nr:unnamed protein product [Acanthocheilonema viteae]
MSVRSSHNSGISGTSKLLSSYTISPYAALEGLYVLHDELGSGGFGKVRLATHLLTSQKVAIKIIDKRKIKKEDLPRIRTELEALMLLSHQNICRLYQCIDTPLKFFIVMEYCSGGEMFDYIVKKERLEESEARHFFRQLVQAVAYVHSMGFAHRDLKPENLLLTEDLQLKLIDFGLCAKPPLGLSQSLHTCCGSPAYAAPELILGLPYKGHQVDVWSMGVLLYTLLCGCLPFEDDNVQKLYAKIAKNVVDEEVVKELAHHFGRSYTQMEVLVKEWKFDYLTATYRLLLQQKRRGMNFVLPVLKPRDGMANPKQIVLGSQTIHASLDNDLNNSGLDENDLMVSEATSKENCTAKSFEEDNTTPVATQHDKNLSYAYAMLNMPSTHSGSSPKQRAACGIRQENDFASAQSIYATPARRRMKPECAIIFDTCLYRALDKENWHSTTTRVRSPTKIDERPRSNLYATPLRVPASCTPSTKMRSRSMERNGTSPYTPRTPATCPAHTPRSLAKTPHLRQRVFASLERQADKMINLLTPRKVKNNQPEMLKQTKTMVNVSITSSKNPDRVRRELIRVFAEQNITTEHHGWKISGRKKDEFNRMMTVELEVVWIEMGNKERLVGVKRKRLNGDAFLYKKVCEQVLKLAGL